MLYIMFVLDILGCW